MTDFSRPEWAPLEGHVPLSQSSIWRRQREFYAQSGMNAWTVDKVPQFITNNPFIAEICADLVLQFLRDCRRQTGGEPISAGNPLHILELGAGTGKFAYLLLRHLAPLMDREGLPPQAVRYHMSDCAEGTLASWRVNSHLAEYVQSGVLDFHRFEAGQGAAQDLAWPRGSRPGPLALVANYVFDSLPQDAFVIQNGAMLESLVRAPAPPGADAAGPRQPFFPGLPMAWQAAPLPDHRYPSAVWNGILEQYRMRLPGATVLFPSAALGVLEELASLSDGRMLVLAADKGHACEDALGLVQGPPGFEWHAPDCFSLMVNFDAIGKYFQAMGGEALLPDKHFSGLNVCGFLLRRPQDRFPATIGAYRQAQARLGPDDLFTLMAWLNAHMEEMTVPQILAALRLSRWDPITLIRLFPVLGRQLRTVTAERYDLRAAVEKIWANHYPVEPGENILAFDCGVILLELRFFAEATAMFKTSQKILGPSAATSYNLGLCAQGLDQPAEALAWMVEACRLDPGFAPAQSARQKLEKESRPSGPVRL